MISINLERLLLEISNEEKISKGEYLYLEQDKADKLYIVQTGKVKISKITDDGQEFTFQIAKEGDIIGEIVLFSELGKFMNNATALTNVSVDTIDKSTLEKELMLKPELMAEYIRWMGETTQKMQSKFRDLLLFGKKGALYSTLIRMSNTYGKVNKDGITIDLKVTNKELSEFCGTTRESINRLLSELKKKEIISTKDNLIVIHDLQFLKDEICCEDCSFEICQI